VVRQGHAAIDRELEYKLQPHMLQDGGWIISLDHRIPNGTHIDDYRYYVRSVRERIGLPPEPQSTGWNRMAF